MTKAAIWNQLKTEYEYSSSLLNKLYGVTYQQASKELLESILEQLQKEVGQGVNEDLSSDVEEVTGNDLITDTNAPINQDKVNSSETLVNYQILPLQTKFSHYSYFTLDNQLTYMRFGNEFHPVEVNLDSKSKTVKDLITQEIHLLNDMFFTAFYGNPCNIQETETTSDIVATVTSDNKFYALVHSQADEVYIVTPYCLNPKRLVDCKDKELKESLYHCKEVAAEEANEWLGDNYQVVEVDYNNICCDIKAYFKNRVLVNQLNCYLPKDEASIKGYYYKGVSVEHFSNYTEMYNNVLNPVDSGNPTVTLLGSFQHTKWVYCSEIKVSSSIEAVKVAKNYLSTGQKVPSTEEAIQPSPLERKSIYA